MYGARRMKTIKQALLNAKADGGSSGLQDADLTNCTFDGHITTPGRGMEGMPRIKTGPDILWDEAWFGSCAFSQFPEEAHRDGGRNEIEAWMA